MIKPIRIKYKMFLIDVEYVQFTERIVFSIVRCYREYPVASTDLDNLNPEKRRQYLDEEDLKIKILSYRCIPELNEELRGIIEETEGIEYSEANPAIPQA